MPINPTDYDPFYDLIEQLEQNPRLLPADTLYEVDEQALYAAMMNRLAQPVNGQPSPFSSMAPGTAHAMIVGAIAYMQSLLGHQLNVKPWRELLQHFRIMGVELAREGFSVVSITFEGSAGATIPAGVEVRSRFDPSLSVYTTQPSTIDSDGRAVVSARFSRTGTLPDIRVGEFSILPASLSQVRSVYNDGTVINPGREPETVTEAVTRARQSFQTGMRAVTARDYHHFATTFGATKAAVLTGLQKGSTGYFGDLVTLVVYPDQVGLIESALTSGTEDFQGVVAGGRLDVIAAEILPIDGTVTLKADPQFSHFELFNRVAAAISATLNPPHGKWGDTDFETNLAAVIERVDGIYAVPSMALKHSETGTPFNELEIHPWNLLEIQQSLNLQVER